MKAMHETITNTSMKDSSVTLNRQTTSNEMPYSWYIADDSSQTPNNSKVQSQMAPVTNQASGSYKLQIQSTTMSVMPKYTWHVRVFPNMFTSQMHIALGRMSSTATQNCNPTWSWTTSSWYDIQWLQTQQPEHPIQQHLIMDPSPAPSLNTKNALAVNKSYMVSIYNVAHTHNKGSTKD